MKKTWISVICSFLFPGLGHLYLGKILKGVIIIILNIIFTLLSGYLIGIPLMFGLWLYSIFNSIKLTKLINEEIELSRIDN